MPQTFTANDIDEILENAEIVGYSEGELVISGAHSSSSLGNDPTGKTVSYGNEYREFPVKQIATSTFKAFVSDFNLGRLNFTAVMEEFKDQIEQYYESSFQWNDSFYNPSFIVYKFKEKEVFLVAENIEDAGRCVQKDDSKIEDTQAVNLTFIFPLRAKKDVLEIAQSIDKYHITETRGQAKTISMVIENGKGFGITRFEIKDRPFGSMSLNYGSKFLDVHEKLISFVENDDTGLILLHGAAGTGKTSYIRHLLSVLDRRVIYIPPNMMHSIGSPNFIGFIQQYEGSVLIIEDAEDILRPREETGNAVAVSNLLNISDGILGDVLKMKVICTFNTDINEIDSALLRKGRLALDYEFKKLSIEESNNLIKSIGKNYITDKEMTLAEVYNLELDNLHTEKVKRSMGF